MWTTVVVVKVKMATGHVKLTLDLSVASFSFVNTNGDRSCNLNIGTSKWLLIFMHSS